MCVKGCISQLLKSCVCFNYVVLSVAFGKKQNRINLALITTVVQYVTQAECKHKSCSGRSFRVIILIDLVIISQKRESINTLFLPL